MAEIVALKLKPKKNPQDQEIYERYDVHGYPTMIFVDAEGQELDRMGDFMPAAEFLKQVQRIQSGDTFASRSERLAENPKDAELLQLVVNGLLLKYDFASAYTRIDAFQASDHGLSPDPSGPLLLEVMALEHDALYRLATRRYRDEWEEVPDVSASRSTPALVAMLTESPAALDRQEQARLLREARHNDAGLLIAMLPEDGAGYDSKILLEAGQFAFENGHYDSAVDLFRRWRESSGADPDPDQLNWVAWSLYQCRKDIEAALEMARAAYALRASPGVADTLAQLLYLTGVHDEAIAIETRAADEAEGQDAEAYRKIVEQMKAGEELTAHPSFEDYPGD